MKLKTLFLLLTGGSILWAVSCKKDPDKIDNPYDSATKKPSDEIVVESFDPNTIQGIYQNVFFPTCANSGCHDGNFEPDFRTIESSYNSLVLHPIVKNNANGDFEFRVIPGNSNQSILVERLVNDIDGISGIMPLSLEPGSDWPTKKSEYIQNIRNWINAGAKDAEGNGPPTVNIPPSMLGVVAFFDSDSNSIERFSLDRELKTNPNFGDTVKIFFSFTDDATNPADFTDLSIRFSSSMFDFENAPVEPLIPLGANAFTDLAYNLQDSVTYTHQANFLTSRAIVNQTLFFRVKMNDGSGITEIPQDGSFDYILKYFAMKFVD